jgi:hypothetical protein
VKRQVAWLFATVVVAIAVGAFLLGPGQQQQPAAGTATTRPNSVYQPSDPALVAATGRPQLVEFFHRA